MYLHNCWTRRPSFTTREVLVAAVLPFSRETLLRLMRSAGKIVYVHEDGSPMMAVPAIV